MEAYLEIAVAVLRAERRPLSPQAILMTAYQMALVPPHLHGKTQHKTLQARLSEDIVERRELSPFFRTAPGRFFLREFLNDPTISDEFRNPFPARRRFRDLKRGPALAIAHEHLRATTEKDIPISPNKIFALLRSAKYVDPKANLNNVALVRSFVCVNRNNMLLSYRVGRYRDDRDSFMLRRSIGFYTLVHVDEHTLFNVDDFGIVDAGIRATRIDLDIPTARPEENADASLAYFIWSTRTANATDLLAVINFECPKWFEPVKRRLALNDLAWLNVSQPLNDIDDFDPWSKLALLARLEVRPRP